MTLTWNCQNIAFANECYILSSANQVEKSFNDRDQMSCTAVKYYICIYTMTDMLCIVLINFIWRTLFCSSFADNCRHKGYIVPFVVATLNEHEIYVTYPFLWERLFVSVRVSFEFLKGISLSLWLQCLKLWLMHTQKELW